jgi:hypothetical protein
MITLQRRLMVRVADSAIQAGNAPKHLKSDSFYPVVGYSVQVKTKKADDTREEKKYEDIQVLYVVNENKALAGVYPSTVDVFIEPVDTKIPPPDMV